MAYSSQEIANDIDSINTKILQLERDSIPRKWQADTLLLVEKIDDYNVTRTSETDINGETVDLSTNRKGYRLIETEALYKSLDDGDSSKKISDSVYVFFECPRYLFATTYGENSIATLSSEELYHSVLAHYRKPDKKKTLKELQQILDKYNHFYLDDRNITTIDISDYVNRKI